MFLSGYLDMVFEDDFGEEDFDDDDDEEDDEEDSDEDDELELGEDIFIIGEWVLRYFFVLV